MGRTTCNFLYHKLELKIGPGSLPVPPMVVGGVHKLTLCPIDYSQLDKCLPNTDLTRRIKAPEGKICDLKALTANKPQHGKNFFIIREGSSLGWFRWSSLLGQLDIVLLCTWVNNQNGRQHPDSKTLFWVQQPQFNLSTYTMLCNPPSTFSPL